MVWCGRLLRLAEPARGLPRAYDHDTWQCNGHDPYSAQGYRLPTEAEWEYACRAGSTTAFANGPITDTVCDDPNLDQIGWYCGNANGWTHPVAQLDANDWGLYDMPGNLWEWCNDWFAFYGGDETDPAGPPGPEVNRVIRGGSWNNDAQYCRSANRSNNHPDYSNFNVGFRPANSWHRREVGVHGRRPGAPGHDQAVCPVPARAGRRGGGRDGW